MKLPEHLERIVNNKTIPNSLLFSGPRGSKIEDLAKSFACAVLETELSEHPDFHEYFPEGKIGMHSIDSMRKFSGEVYTAPFSASKKLFIVHDAERMLATSANALLKTFEEPAKDSIIILTSYNPASLLPTILSRCTTVRFPQVENEKKQMTPEREHLFQVLSKGHFSHYNELKDAAKTIADHITQRQELERTNLTEEAYSRFSDTPTAAQKEAVEKEVEGILSLQMAAISRSLFCDILSWYRDALLIRLKGDLSLLMNPTYHTTLQNVPDIPLEKIEQSLSTAKLSLERFTPFHMVLERLFLEII